MTPRARRLLTYVTVGACLSVLVGAPLAVFTFDLVTEPYPPADWEAAAFTGTVIETQSDEPGRRHKHEWAIVRTDDGPLVRMPREVHNGLPQPQHQVRKLAGQVTFDLRGPDDPAGTWDGPITPAPEPGAGLQTGVTLWVLWSAALFAVSLALSSYDVLRRRDESPTIPPSPPTGA